VRNRVAATLEMLGLTGIANRRAQGFTADIKQKISLGRGVVRQDVNAILFDEPLTVIDPQMKWQLRSQLKALHRQFGHTMVYVTHDQTEALTFADKVVVMYGGEIVQIGTPAELFERPSHTFVGYFIGSPGMNILPAALSGTELTVGPMKLGLPAAPKAPTGAKVELGVRPEYVRIGREGTPVTIDKVEDIGRLRIVRATLDGMKIAATLPEGVEIPAEPRMAFDPHGVNVYANSRLIAGGAA
jgi:glycerol transport system ATP-binding protein